MSDQDSRAAASFYRAVRRFAETATGWQTNAIFYETKPDEKFDLMLISRRVYGRPDEYLAVMAAAGLDSVDQELKQRRIILPNEHTLMSIKRECNFESIPDLREDGAPLWAGA